MWRGARGSAGEAPASQQCSHAAARLSSTRVPRLPLLSRPPGKLYVPEEEDSVDGDGTAPKGPVVASS